MIRPKPLKKDDVIGIIGTSGPPEKERIEPAVRWIQSLGLKVKFGKSVYKTYGYLCGDDSIRAYDVNSMFKDKEIRGIFVLRGGYGCSRILNMIDFENIKKNPKIFTGYSDVTALHISINQRCNMTTFHTPMVCTEFYKKSDDYTLKSFKNNIFQRNISYNILNTTNIKMECLVGGKAYGKITGGNLSVITSLMGTPYEIDTKGKILFLEDVDEPPYKIDRMLMQLKMGNKFKDACGIVLGMWKGCSASDIRRSLTLKEVFEDIIVPENRPTIMNLACGHYLPSLSIPMGDRFYIDADNLEIKHL